MAAHDGTHEPSFCLSSLKTVGVTLWGATAEELGSRLEQEADAIISISSCRVTDFNGEHPALHRTPVSVIVFFITRDERVSISFVGCYPIVLLTCAAAGECTNVEPEFSHVYSMQACRQCILPSRVINTIYHLLLDWRRERS